MEFKHSLSFPDDGLVVTTNELILSVGSVTFVMAPCDLALVSTWYARLKKVFVER